MIRTGPRGLCLVAPILALVMSDAAWSDGLVANAWERWTSAPLTSADPAIMNSNPANPPYLSPLRI